MTTTTLNRQSVVAHLNSIRPNYGGTDAQFAKKWGINSTTWSTIKNGMVEGHLLKETKWLDLARELGIAVERRQWQAARTEVFEHIESMVKFCAANSKAIILVDDPEIGKTYTAKYLAKSLSNCFYMDCSQAKTRTQFVRNFCATIGIDNRGTYTDMKASIKNQLRSLRQPVVILDEAGDLDYNTFLELKEFWNATDGACGWYMMGADGLRTKWERGMRNGKVGFREMFSRYNGKYTTIVPTDRQERQQFYNRLITDVIKINTTHQADIPQLVRKCIASDAAGEIGGLRRAETLLIAKERSHEDNE